MFRDMALAIVSLAVVVLLLPIAGDFGEIASFGLFLVAFALGAVWFLATPTAAHEAEDVLGDRFGSYFEGEGLCFAAEFIVHDGVCWVSIFYQNRYNANCSSRAYIVPMEGWSVDGLNDVPPVVAEIECGGGDVGVLHIPYPIAKSWQGKIMIYDVMAKTTYPVGRGELVRRDGGMLVDPPSSKTGDAVEALTTAALLLAGFVRISDGRRGKIETRLPEGVADVIPPGIVAHEQLISEWDPPTGGFPVS